MKPRRHVVCFGWFDADRERVHADVRVLTPGDPDGPVSEGICPPCKAAFFDKLATAESPRGIAHA